METPTLPRAAAAARPSARQVALVRESWASIEPIAAQAAQLFYARLFELDPALRALFRGDLHLQGGRLMAALSAGYGVRPHHYATVGSALLWTLERGLGDAFDARLEDAWRTAYAALAAAMQEGDA